MKASPSAIAAVGGNPAQVQTVVLARGAKAPARGGYLVVDATSSGPGILGKVIAAKRLSDGRTRLSLTPATLDQAYEKFDLGFDGSLSALSDSPSLRTEQGATAPAHSSASKLKVFTCKGPQMRNPDIVVDLTPLRVSSDIDVLRKRVHFLISGKPVLRLRFELKAGASCRLNENVKVFIPVAGPVGIDLAPVVEISTGADSKLDFELRPRIAVGFDRGGSSANEDHRVFNPAGGVSVTPQGSLGVDAFAGGSIGVSVGGRVGIRGKFGPFFTARGSASPDRICADVKGALRIGLDVYADVFIANMKFQVAKGDFLARALYSKCVGGGGSGNGGSGGGGSGSGGGGSGSGGEGPPGTFRPVSAGLVHTCAVRSDDAIACWGYDGEGQASPPAGTFKSVSAGHSYTCAIRTGGSIACWGWGKDDQSSLPAGTFKSVSAFAGSSHTCAIRSDDSVACWGYDEYGQASPPAGTFKSVSAGGSHTCAIRSDDSIACWGASASGQASPPAGSFRSVSAGFLYTCAIRSDDSVACWGNDEYGETSPPAG